MRSNVSGLYIVYLCIDNRRHDKHSFLFSFKLVFSTLSQDFPIPSDVIISHNSIIQRSLHMRHHAIQFGTVHAHQVSLPRMPLKSSKRSRTDFELMMENVPGGNLASIKMDCTIRQRKVHFIGLWKMSVYFLCLSRRVKTHCT